MGLSTTLADAAREVDVIIVGGEVLFMTMSHLNMLTYSPLP